MIDERDLADFARLSARDEPAEYDTVWWLQGTRPIAWEPIAHDMHPDRGWWQAMLAWCAAEGYSRGERPIVVQTYRRRK